MANNQNSTDKVKATEQYVKDVRSIETDENVHARTTEEEKEAEQNDRAQEENKKSQMNAELDAKFGDCSEPEKSKINKVDSTESKRP